MKPATRFWVALAAVAALALGLRLAHLSAEEFVEGDDATYYMTARSAGLILEWVWDRWPAVVAGSADPGELQARFAVAGVEMRFAYYCKPFFDLLNITAGALWGPRPEVMLWMNAAFGVVAVFLIGWIGRHLFGDGVGLAAAALLGVSGSALIFSRSGMAHMASIALALAALVAYCRCQRPEGYRAGGLLLAGIFGGLSLATHPNLLPFLGLLLLLEGIVQVGLRGLRTAVLRVGWLGGGAAAALGGIALVLALYGQLVAGALAVLPPSPAPFMTYFQQLTAHTQAVVDGRVSLAEKLYTYILVLWAHEGGPVLLLVVVATAAYSLRPGQRSPGLLPLLVLFWVPLAFFVLSRNQAVYRYAAGLVVPACLLAAWALVRGGAWLAPRWGLGPGKLAFGLALGLCCYNALQVLPVFTTKSAWASASRWLEAQGEHQVLSSAGAQLWRFSRIDAEPLGDEQGHPRYWAVYRRYPKAAERQLQGAVEAKGLAPVFSAEHRRPTKELEVQFVRDSWILAGMQHVPVIGPRIASMRREVLDRNRRCVIEIYDLAQVEVAAWSPPFSGTRGASPFATVGSERYVERF